MILFETAPGVIIAAIGLAVSILAALIKVIFSMGQMISKINNVEAEMREIGKDLAAHLSNSTLHVNKELQDAVITESRRFQDQTQSRLNDMAKDLRDLLLGRKNQ